MSFRGLARCFRCGEFGCYLVEDSFTLAPGTSTEWFIIADTGLDHAAVVRLRHQLVAGESIREEVAASLASNAADVRRRVAAADGLQASADRTVAVHHFSNTLFNIMRGGVPADGYRCPRGDLSGFVARRNAGVHARHREWLEADADRDLAGLAAEVADRGDPHLRRIVREYLPMCFGRRHGDPSRPWNRFSIATRDPLGRPVLGYSGNWRDIFQNWEALSYSHPGCLPGMVAVFLNASTVDGYNPYRITRDGIDWEVADASDPWSHIGYWGDHQIVYLLRLLEAHERFWPGRLAADLDTPIYAAAVVPYRISGFDDLLRDPRHSIAFDKDLHQSLRAKMAREGGDGALATAGDGEPRLYSLAEKLLVPALVKLSNLVPDGGIWLNTQRPEWNDANNALAGWGLSVVTVCHLRRHLRFLDGLVAAHAGSNLRLTAATADLVEGLAAAVATGEPGDRFAVFEALGRAGEQHRDAVYAGGSDERREVSIAVIRGVLAAGGQLVDDTIRANRRPDGMYHSYNRLDVLGRRAEIHHFELMLEGQVAVLSSGLLDDTAALKLLAALRASPLYREDQRSYLLQPDRDPVPYLERNRLPADWSTRCPGLAARVAAGATDVVVVDIHGDGHFHADTDHAAAQATDDQPADVAGVIQRGHGHLQRQGGVAHREGDALQDRLKQRPHVGAAGAAGNSRGRVQARPALQGRGIHHREVELRFVRAEAVEEVERLVHDPLGARAVAVDLVHHHDGLQAQRQRFARDEARLRHRPFDRVDQQQHAVHHRQGALHLAAEVGVARGVDNIDVHAVEIHRRVLGQDRDAALFFDVVRIHHPFGDALVRLEGTGLLQQLVDERRLAMVDVGDDGDITKVRTSGSHPETLRGLG